MGANLAFNFADHGYRVALYDEDELKAAELAQGKEGAGMLKAGKTVRELADILHRPRAVLLMVPAGKPVDDVIAALVPYFDEADLIIDGGNSHFSDTNRREKLLTAKGMLFMGMGISGANMGRGTDRV